MSEYGISDDLIKDYLMKTKFEGQNNFLRHPLKLRSTKLWDFFLVNCLFS